MFRLWDGAGIELPPTGDGSANSIASSRDGRWLAVGGTDHFIRLYDRKNGRPPRSLEATKPPVGSLAFHPAGELLAQRPVRPTDSSGCGIPRPVNRG